jgi:hypothetical protein
MVDRIEFLAPYGFLGQYMTRLIERRNVFVRNWAIRVDNTRRA